MKELKGAARRLLFELGAPVSTKGFTYAVDILCDSVVNQKPIAYREKIYDHLAEKFGETPYSIEIRLRYLKNECLDQYNERFRSIFGNATSVGTYDFLEMLRFCLMDELEEM